MKNFINRKRSKLNSSFSFVSCIFSEGISALVELPKNCVAAAVGKELSEYVAFLLNVHVPL